MSPNSPFPTDKGLRDPVCVFCGSSPGNDMAFTEAAIAVGKSLAAERIPLVYGGGRRGIMGVVSKATLDAGGYVHGILPKALVERASEHTPAPGGEDSKKGAKSGEGVGQEVLDDEHDGRLTTEVVGSMHERKLKMAQLSTGGFIALPGGFGTFEELFEMVTWSQLGIHHRPVLALSIDGFYDPLKALVDGAVKSGFITSTNQSLLTIIDLPGSSAEEWGKASMNHLEEWSVKSGTAYGLKWDTSQAENLEKPDGNHSVQESLALFTTLRYTSPSMHLPALPVEKDIIPLLDRHITRLREAHSHFATRYGMDVWGEWIGDEQISQAIKNKLESVERVEQGDWRVRVLIKPKCEVEVQVVPAPAGAGPFQFRPSRTPPFTGRLLLLDPRTSDLSSETSQERDQRLYKTTNRIVYDTATARGDAITTQPHTEVLLHTKTHILETTTSNIAVQDPESGQWITPRLDNEHTPFLDGVMRRELLEARVIREEVISLEDWVKWMEEGRRVVGFNGLRGVWEAEVACSAAMLRQM